MQFARRYQLLYQLRFQFVRVLSAPFLKLFRGTQLKKNILLNGGCMTFANFPKICFSVCLQIRADLKERYTPL